MAGCCGPRHTVRSHRLRSGRPLSPVPAWETPYLSAQGTSTADVVVLWTADAAHKGWAAATLFALQRTGGRWLIVDAQDLATGKIPKPLKNK
jgi:hypothetical protein